MELLVRSPLSLADLRWGLALILLVGLSCTPLLTGLLCLTALGVLCLVLLALLGLVPRSLLAFRFVVVVL